MKTEPMSEPLQEGQPVNPHASTTMTFSACVAAAIVPGLGHALFRKWDRALVFFGCIVVMFVLGIQLDGRIFGPEIGNLFSTLKFMAEAGSGLLYWVSLVMGFGTGDPTAYTFDYANVFIYVAGLLNMLVIVDVFDIAMGRKQ
jgi:hypothetical protein